MSEQLTLTKETEEKRLRDFEKRAKEWDDIPERQQGFLEGFLKATAMLFLEDKKAGQESERENNQVH